ncbi:MAG: hypothetical protein ABIG30_02335, partial [Candidatus Aenigmatarchaeota archaeon]
MISDPRISQILVETGGYRDVPPVLLTSGEVGIYYINTEKIAQDDGEFNRFGDDSGAMITHAIKMVEEHPSFGEVIDRVSESVKSILYATRTDCDTLIISGGQRRDWLFSGPVAAKLDLLHASIYKDGEIEVVNPHDGKKRDFSLGGVHAFHVADLLTEGSSFYRLENDIERGWVPALRNQGAEIRDAVVIVTRLQGGEEMLAKQGVNVHSFVAIDEDFLRTHSGRSEIAVAYQRNPSEWTEAYLRENGALAFVDAFNPAGGKQDRAMKFLQRYGGVLKDSGHWDALHEAVTQKFG